MPLPSFYTTKKWVADYIEYQRQYNSGPRESDLRFLSMLDLPKWTTARILDVGCNTGNLLRMVQDLYPKASLYGIDIVPEFVNEARTLSKEIQYDVADMLSYQADTKFDVITFNASLMCLDDGELLSALIAASKNLVPNGILVAFDYFHPYTQNLEIREFSTEDQILHMRSFNLIKNLATAARFKDIEFTPFVLSQDLPQEQNSRKTYTRTLDGVRASFRGVLYQPWCFLKAKAS